LKRRVLQFLKVNKALTVPPADKCNAAVVLCTPDYNQKITTLLEDKAYKKLKEDPTDSVERKTVLLLKKSLFAEEVCHQLLPQGSRPPILYKLTKIHKPGITIKANCEHRCFPHLSHGPTLGGPTWLPHGLLPTQREKLIEMCPHPVFSPRLHY
jgi:hypothetical protein